MPTRRVRLIQEILGLVTPFGRRSINGAPSDLNFHLVRRWKVFVLRTNAVFRVIVVRMSPRSRHSALWAVKNITCMHKDVNVVDHVGGGVSIRPHLSNQT
jgi:hypothetical protein